MQKLVDVFRILLVSVEALWLLLMGCILFWKSNWFNFVGRNLLEHEDVTSWMPAIPIALCGTTIFLVFKLLAPSEANNKTLYEWPEYWRLEYRRNIGVVWCVVSVGLVLVAWIFRGALSNECIGGLFSSSIGLALISAGSMLLGACSLKVIIERHTE